MLKKGINLDASKLIFGDLDWTKFEVSQKEIDGKPKIILFNSEDDIEIDENVYFRISQYLRNVFNMNPEEKITSDKTLRQWYINKDKRQKKIDEEKEKNGEHSDTSIQSIISACVNHPGFKYNLEELKNVGVCQFYDSVKRIQVYESTTALMKGMYSGMIDASHLKPESYNFMKTI